MDVAAAEDGAHEQGERTGRMAARALAPLTRAKIARTVAIVRRGCPDEPDLRFETIELLEPEKAQVWSLGADALPPTRIARANIVRPSWDGVTRLVVALDPGVIVAETILPDARPMIQPEQFLAVEEGVRRDPAFVAGCARRGIEDMALVCIDPWSAGRYVNQSDGTGGLPDMIAHDRGIENADIVVWHVFGLHHPARPEDFPVQPCVTSGFKLMPFGFFDGNPCIDLPPDVNAASRRADAGPSRPAHPR